MYLDFIEFCQNQSSLSVVLAIILCMIASNKKY